jgi:sporulation protein YlmC with PRC-barrel domain
MGKNRKSSEQEAPILLVSGFICGESQCALSVEVRRGMLIQASDGQEAGRVAAVVLERGSGQATHLLLTRLPEVTGYHMVPVKMVAQVGQDSLRLNISAGKVGRLPRWSPTQPD